MKIEIITNFNQIDQRRKIIYSMNEQTRIQKINNYKCTVLSKELLSPQIKIDRKLFSVSPTSVLSHHYNLQGDCVLEDKSVEFHIKKKLRRRRECNQISPSADYKRVYKSITQDFRL